MPDIKLLDCETIDKIAAGEVVERPSSVVKELVENAIDAGAKSITVEIKEGGIGFIRITDNGCGIEKSQVKLAFLRHSTSKIRSAADLSKISSLGFRGEALSSISAVAQVELITKRYQDVSGTRYVIEGSNETAFEEIGAPDGTTFIVRNLFYNTPARRKFLKSATTEGGYVTDLMEHMALSHPEIAFCYIINGQTKIQTSGNSREKDLIYHIFGRDITASLMQVESQSPHITVRGYIARPIVARGNRNYENFFVNGRFIKSNILSRALEDGYKGFMMQHQYPFSVLYIDVDTSFIDVNVHPSKMEIRFSDNEQIYNAVCDVVKDSLNHRELIPQVSISSSDIDVKKSSTPLERARAFVAKDSPYETKYPKNKDVFESLLPTKEKPPAHTKPKDRDKPGIPVEQTHVEQIHMEIKEETTYESEASYEQQSLFSEDKETGFLTKEAKSSHRIIGQLFETYWLVEYDDKLFLIDQHAAHEKVLYERTMKRLKENTFSSQTLSPPVILTLDAMEEQMLNRYMEEMASFGYSISHFGGKEYAIDAVPAEFETIDLKGMFVSLLDDFQTSNSSAAGRRQSPDQILEKVASMSCKAAIKGNQRISEREAYALIDELLSLDNPYQCPHGRPTIITMSKYEIEKKFKRIV